MEKEDGIKYIGTLNKGGFSYSFGYLTPMVQTEDKRNKTYIFSNKNHYEIHDGTGDTITVTCKGRVKGIPPWTEVNATNIWWLSADYTELHIKIEAKILGQPIVIKEFLEGKNGAISQLDNRHITLKLYTTNKGELNRIFQGEIRTSFRKLRDRAIKDSPKLADRLPRPAIIHTTNNLSDKKSTHDQGKTQEKKLIWQPAETGLGNEFKKLAEKFKNME